MPKCATSTTLGSLFTIEIARGLDEGFRGPIAMATSNDEAVLSPSGISLVSSHQPRISQTPGISRLYDSLSAAFNGDWLVIGVPHGTDAFHLSRFLSTPLLT